MLSSLAATRRLPLDLAVWSGVVVGLWVELRALQRIIFALYRRDRLFQPELRALLELSSFASSGPGLLVWALTFALGLLAWRRGARRGLRLASGLGVALALTAALSAVHGVLRPWRF